MKSYEVVTKCTKCGYEEFNFIDNPDGFYQYCRSCSQKLLSVNKKEIVNEFECPNCKALSGTLEENKKKTGIRCNNCNELFIVLEKPRVDVDNINNPPRRFSAPKCPTCNSTRIEKISTTKKVLGGAMFGLFSSDVRNTMVCKSCGYKW